MDRSEQWGYQLVRVHRIGGDDEIEGGLEQPWGRTVCKGGNRARIVPAPAIGRYGPVELACFDRACTLRKCRKVCLNVVIKDTLHDVAGVGREHVPAERSEGETTGLREREAGGTGRRTR